MEIEYTVKIENQFKFKINAPLNENGKIDQEKADELAKKYGLIYVREAMRGMPNSNIHLESIRSKNV